MDVVLIIVGFICIVIGLAGCILPVIPGTPLSYLGLLLLHWTSNVHYSSNTLWALGIATVIVSILDYLLPVWVTKWTGGSKYGTWGATVGLIVGIFILPPVGIIVAPFFGALIGELMANNDNEKALKSAMGAFAGFLLGTGFKLIVSGVITYYFFKELIPLII